MHEQVCINLAKQAKDRLQKKSHTNKNPVAKGRKKGVVS